jgi:hypothetical protein
MRRELADVVKALLDTVDEDADITLADSEVDTLLRRRQRREHGVELPVRTMARSTRCGLTPRRCRRATPSGLVQIARGGIALGMTCTRALQVAMRCKDSMRRYAWQS